MEQGITIFHKDENLRPQQPDPPKPKPKRGPLNVNEQLALIEICRKQAKYNIITQYTSQFWIGIEVDLQTKIGRRYSHYSCRRRVNDYIAQRTIYRDAVRKGLRPPYQDIPELVCLAVDGWILANDKEELEAKVRKRDAIAKLTDSSLQLSQTTKLQRVADWVKGIPDPDPSFINPRPFSGLEPSWHFLAEARAKRLSHISTPAGLVSARGSIQIKESNSTQAVRDTSVIKKEPESPIRIPPATIQAPIQHHPAVLNPPSPLLGRKRPRDDDITRSDRAIQRPRIDLPTAASHELKANQTPRERALAQIKEDTSIFQPGVDTIFCKFWDHMLPYFKERESKGGVSLANSESIMHELFKDVGSALVRAFIKLEECSQAS